jgi:hypothetical protein
LWVVAKDPFYMKDTRDVFRTMFGDPNDGMTFMRAYFYLPLYVKFGGAVVKILRVWLEAPEVWDVVTYMADLKKQLSESIAENEERKREEAEKKAQEREEKKRAKLEKTTVKKEGKNTASVGTASGDGELPSKKKKKKKKQKPEVEKIVVTGSSNAVDLDLKKGEEKKQQIKAAASGEESKKETGKSKQFDENKHVKRSKEVAKVELNTPTQREAGKIDKPSELDDEGECIAPTAQLFKDWRPAPPEPRTMIDEPPFWKKRDEFGRPQFPFLGFHRDPDELGVKTPSSSTDTSSDSISPSGSTELPKVLLDSKAIKSPDAKSTGTEEVTTMMDEQQAQEKLLKSNKSFLEEMEIAGFPWAEDLGGMFGRHDMFDEKLFRQVQKPDKPQEQSYVGLREDYMSEMALPNQETDLKKLIPIDSIDNKPTATGMTSDYDMGKMPDAVTREALRADFVDDCEDMPLLSAATAAKMVELDKLDLASGFKFRKGELAPRESEDTDDHELDIKAVVLGVQEEGDDSYAVFSQDDGRSSNEKYQNTIMVPQGGTEHFSETTVETSESSSPNDNFEGSSLNKGSDDQDSKSDDKISKPANVASISDIVRLANELTQGNPQGVRVMVFRSDDGFPNPDDKAEHEALVDKLVSSLKESFSSLTLDSKPDSKKSKENEANLMKPTDAVKEFANTDRSTVKHADVVEEEEDEDTGKVTLKHGDTVMEIETMDKMTVKHEVAKGTATCNSKMSGDVEGWLDLPGKMSSRSIVKSSGKSVNQPMKEKSKQKEISFPQTVKPVVSEFSGGAGWVRAFCNSEVLSKFDGHFRQSIFLRNVTPEQLLAKTTSRPRDVPKREFPSLEEGTIADPNMVDFMKKTTGGVFFITRLGTYSLLKHTKWAAFYGAFICSHACHSEEKLWKKHAEKWKKADLQMRKSVEPRQPVTNGYFSTVYVTYNHVVIPILYCYLDWNLQMLTDIQLPRDAEMVCCIRYVLVSPRGNEHILDFISSFLEMSEGKVLHTLLFPMFDTSLERGGTIKQIPVDRVDRPAIVSAYRVVKPSGGLQFLEKVQEQVPEMVTSPGSPVGVMDLVPFKMSKTPLPHSAVIMKSPAGRQILSEFLKGCLKEKQERARRIAAGLDPDAFSEGMPFETKSVAQAEKGSTKRKGKGKGKGKQRRQDVEEPIASEQLRTCAYCGKEETTPKVFKRCKLCLDQPSARYYCSRECQAKDWKEKHRLDHT